MIAITLMQSEKIKQGVVRVFDSFDDLADQFKECTKGEKLGGGFTRGELSPPVREDENATTSKILIIDGDEGPNGRKAPEPIRVHECLIQLKLNHFIYTSHSHQGKKKPKYRVVIECDQPYYKHELRANNVAIMMALEQKMIRIKHVKEMDAFSQIWFDARRDDPEDGLYEFYSYNKGNKWSVIHVEESQAEDEKESAEVTEGTGQSLDEFHEDIRKGRTYHIALRTLSYQYVKDGMSIANTKALLKSLMEGSEGAGTEQWTIRYDAIDHLVDGIKTEGEAFDLDDGKEKEVRSAMPRPPGLLGELFDAAYGYLLLQTEEVAIAGAIGAVAAVVGRKFNVVEPMPTGLNVFLTIIANTGCGKDRINDFIRLCMDSAAGDEGLRSYESFIAPSHFYSPKAITDHFKDARSGVSVISEGGMMMKVKAGSVEAKTAFMLDALQCSHANGYTKAHGYSKAEDSMPKLRAMAMTVISESTPSQMLEAYSATGALTSGYLPRQICLRITKNVTSSNRRIKRKLPEHLVSRFVELCEKCASVQAEDNPQAHELVFEDGVLDEYYDYYDKTLAMKSEYAGVDEIKSNMSSRAAQKAIRLAGLATVFNKTSKDTDALVIEKDAWDWAKAFVEYEYENVTSALAGLNGDQDLDNAVLQVYRKMVDMINDDIKDAKCRLSRVSREKKRIPYSKLRIAIKNNSVVNNIADKNGRMQSGLDKVLDNMRQNKAVLVHDKCPDGTRSAKVIEVLYGMKEYITGYGV